MHLQVRTWIHEDQRYEEQALVVTSKTVGERLGDNVLLPMPLRHLSCVAEEIEAAIEAASLPPDVIGGGAAFGEVR